MVVEVATKPIVSEASLSGASIKAAVLPAPGKDIEFREFAKPKLKNGQVLVRTIMSEVCGTDVHLQDGQLDGVPYPIIPGHFAVGTVEEVRGDPRTVAGRPIWHGDTVTFLDVHGTCHRCWQCQVDKAPTKCSSRKVYGVTHSADEGLFGGWSEMILLDSDVAIAHLPEKVSPLRYMSGGCAMPTAVHAVERGRVQVGSIVVIQGAGPVGLCAAMVAYRSGARVFVADRSPVRLQAARDLGFGVLEVTEDDNVARLLKAATGGRYADIVIEATGNPSAVSSGIKLARDGGRYVIVGHYSDAGETRINPHHDVNRKHLEILGTWGIEYIHFHRAMELLAGDNLTPSGKSIEEVVPSVYPLSEVQRALKDVRERRVVKAIISLQGEVS